MESPYQTTETTQQQQQFNYYYPNYYYNYHQFYQQPYSATNLVDYQTFQPYSSAPAAASSNAYFPFELSANGSKLNSSLGSTDNSVSSGGSASSPVASVSSLHPSTKAVDESTPISSERRVNYFSKTNSASSVNNELAINQHKTNVTTSPELKEDDSSDTSAKRETRSKRRSRTQFSKQQIDCLEAVFNKSHYPEVHVVDKLSEKLGLSIERISVWFQNRRAKFKKTKKPTSMSFKSDSNEGDLLEEASQSSLSIANRAGLNSSSQQSVNHLNVYQPFSLVNNNNTSINQISKMPVYAQDYELNKSTENYVYTNNWNATFSK